MSVRVSIHWEGTYESEFCETDAGIGAAKVGRSNAERVRRVMVKACIVMEGCKVKVEYCTG